MNEELEMELEIVELGDAKEETKGLPPGHTPEDGSTVLYRFPYWEEHVSLNVIPRNASRRSCAGLPRGRPDDLSGPSA